MVKRTNKTGALCLLGSRRKRFVRAGGEKRAGTSNEKKGATDISGKSKMYDPRTASSEK